MSIYDNLNILVLEDSVTDFDLLRYQLKSDGLAPELYHVQKKEEFLNYLSDRPPELVIADYNLPSFNGLDALKIVKEKNQDLPFILLSGSISSKGERQILSEGADDVIFKSNLGRITFAIKRALRNAEDKRKLRETTAELKGSLEEKQILIREIHHRVKNNLAVVSGLLELRKFDSESEYFIETVDQIILKIKSIGLVHETLYQSQNFTHIDFNNFLSGLVQHLSELYQTDENQIPIEKNEFDLSLNVNQAIPLGLIISELTINAMQSSFRANQKDVLRITVKADGEKVEVQISDNRDESERYLEELDDDSGVGTKIVRALVKQIDADFTVEKEKGTRILITFEKKDKKGIGNALF